MKHVPLFDVCRPTQWKTIAASELTPSGYPVYGANGKIGFYPEFNHAEPTVLVTCRGATCGTVNISEPYSYVNGNAMALDNLDRSRADVSFVARYLSHRKLDDVISGSAQPQITRDGLKKVTIPLPPLPEQRRIAAILDRADSLRAKRRESIAKLDQLLQSVFLDMFGDPVTNPKGWPISRFGLLCENEDARRVPIKRADRENRSGPYPYYGASGIIDTLDEYLFDGERLLVAEDGANLVMRSTPIAFIAKGKYWVNNHAHILAENDNADLRFLERTLEQLDLKPYITGSAQPKLNQSNLDRIEFPVPPMAMQRRYRQVCERLETERSRSVLHAERLDDLFNTTQALAFSGEL